jgi:hypothetical protein
MARLRQRDTGSVIVVPDDKADAMSRMGDYELVQDSSGSKTATKKAAAKKSS